MPSAPVPLTGATPTNSSIPTFYKSIYTSANNILGSENPLTKPRSASNSYKASACAYVWGLPLQQFWEKQGLYITGAADGGAAINNFFIGDTINQTTTIVTPNTQVLYTNAFLDLSNQILKVTYPTPQTGTYTLIQSIDPYTNVQFSDGSAYQTSSSGTSSQTFYWSGASESILNEAANIDNAIAIASPQIWVLGRTEIDPYQTPNSATIATTPYQKANTNAGLNLSSSYDINKTFAITSTFQDDDSDTLPTSAVTEEADNANDFFTQLSNAVYSNGTFTYYSGTTNGALNTTGTLYDQSSLFNQFGQGAYSIGLTAALDNSGFKGATTDISNGYQNAKSAIKQISSSTADSSTNYWTINTTLGQYQPTYALRGSNWLTGAAVAAIGLGANIAADGTYPQTGQDQAGNALDGSEDYSISFDTSTLPPVNEPGSWSITVYNSNNEIISNTINSYYIDQNDPNATVASNVFALGSDQFPELTNENADSFSLTLSSNTPTSPSANQTTIPTPADGSFNLVMRLYNPKPANSEDTSDSILSPSNPWIPPAINILTTTTNGPLRKSKVHLDKDGNFFKSNGELELKTDQNGQYPKERLRGKGTLVLNGGKDQLTGNKHKGILFAKANAEVISPTTTLDWGLKKSGFSEGERNQILDHLIEKIHDEMTGEKLKASAKKLHKATEIAPHQIARTDHKQATSMANAVAVTNAYLGEIMAIKLKKSQRHHQNKAESLHQYAQSVMQFSRKLEKQLSNHPNKSTEEIFNAAIQPHGNPLKTNLLNLDNEITALNYHDFINVIASH